MTEECTARGLPGRCWGFRGALTRHPGWAPAAARLRSRGFPRFGGLVPTLPLRPRKPQGPQQRHPMNLTTGSAALPMGITLRMHVRQKLRLLRAPDSALRVLQLLRTHRTGRRRPPRRSPAPTSSSSRFSKPAADPTPRPLGARPLAEFARDLFGPSSTSRRSRGGCRASSASFPRGTSRRCWDPLVLEQLLSPPWGQPLLGTPVAAPERRGGLVRAVVRERPHQQPPEPLMLLARTAAEFSVSPGEESAAGSSCGPGRGPRSSTPSTAGGSNSLSLESSLEVAAQLRQDLGKPFART